jgi:hypothetical protein
MPTSDTYEGWLRSLEPLLLLRAFIVDHAGLVPTASALDVWLEGSASPATAVGWSSLRIARVYGSLHRAIAAAFRLGPLVRGSSQGQWLPSQHTIESAYGSWQAALIDADVLEDDR